MIHIVLVVNNYCFDNHYTVSVFSLIMIKNMGRLLVVLYLFFQSPNGYFSLDGCKCEVNVTSK